MRPNCLFLQDLNSDADQLKKISCTALYTPLDLTILPARSSIVSFAPVIRFFVPVHLLMVNRPPVLKIIDQLLSKKTIKRYL